MAIGKIYQPPETDLNFSTDWNLMPQSVKDTFIGKPKRVKLEPGFMLYKFTEYDLANLQGKITEWWSPVYPYGLDPGLSARIRLAKHIGAAPADLTRVVAAVKENWNALTYVLKARLKKPVYGLWGQCAAQSRRDLCRPARPGIAAPPARGDMPIVRTTNLPGYAWQFYIPKLTYEHIMRVGRDRI
jgi:hypothetical protein